MAADPSRLTSQAPGSPRAAAEAGRTLLSMGASLRGHRRAVIAVAAAGVLVLVVLAGTLYVAFHTANVTVVNDTSSSVRLSGCYIDDALDLEAGQRASQDIPSGRWGCDVYRYPLEARDYVGCLVIGSHDRSYRLARDVSPMITEKQCDNIR